MEYQRCNRCIMDNVSDDLIWFDSKGNCNYCNYALAVQSSRYFPNEIGRDKLEKMLQEIRKNGKNKKYDCVMGISGGLDSSYLLYLGHLWGLRILAVHIDDGFDEEVSKENIRKLCQKTNVDLKIIRPDKTQYNELIRAYILANVPNLAVPQDNILFAYIYRFAKENKIDVFLSGSNFSLENIIQRDNSYSAFDVVNIKAINKQFGRSKINKLAFISSKRLDFQKIFFPMKTMTPLDFIDYNREKAIKDLEEFCGFQYYGSKHLENKFTKILQLYWFPKKYNVDKRKSHLSSMIVTNQMTRQEALEFLNRPLYDESEMKKDIGTLLEAIDLSQEEFQKIMSEEGKQHTDYRTSLYMFFRNKLAILRRKLRTRE